MLDMTVDWNQLPAFVNVTVQCFASHVIEQSMYAMPAANK